MATTSGSSTNGRETSGNQMNGENRNSKDDPGEKSKSRTPTVSKVIWKAYDPQSQKDILPEGAFVETIERKEYYIGRYKKAQAHSTECYVGPVERGKGLYKCSSCDTTDEGALTKNIELLYVSPGGAEWVSLDLFEGKRTPIATGISNAHVGQKKGKGIGIVRLNDEGEHEFFCRSGRTTGRDYEVLCRPATKS